MSESFSAARGRKVVSRASARQLGTIEHVVIDVSARRVTALVLGKGRRAKLVDWDAVTGFGPDAAMVLDDDVPHSPADDRERATAQGKSDLLGRRVLTDLGEEMGSITDVIFDPETGTLETLHIAEHEEPAASLLGCGSYAAIIRAPERSA